MYTMVSMDDMVQGKDEETARGGQRRIEETDGEVRHDIYKAESGREEAEMMDDEDGNSLSGGSARGG